MTFRRLLLIALFIAAAGPVSAAAQEARPPAADTRQRDLVLGPLTKPTPSQGLPRGYALIIGISTYKNLDDEQQLKFAQSDAEAMLRTLISQEGGAFPAENVRTLLGPDATLANITSALETWLPLVAKPEDRVVVYFAGHGFVEGGVGYLAPWDVDPTRLAATAYPMRTLGEVLASRVKAHWKVLLTDACHSGKINTETTNQALDTQFGALPTNFLTLTATTERESSHEDVQLGTGFGFFTYFLTEAWRGAADNDPCDGRISADEIIDYVRTYVRRYARDRGFSQTPTARGDYDPDMLLGVSMACLSPTQLTRVVGTTIIETNMEEVDVYIDDELRGRIGPGRPLRIPGLSAGQHQFKGVRAGYEPDVKEILIAPGQDVTVTLRIRYARVIKKSAVELWEQGERLFSTRRSSINPLNIVPIDRSQSVSDLTRARDLFTRALAEDPGYAQAAFRLGQTQQLLDDQPASLAAFRKALAIDPSYVEARVAYAGVLIESGDVDQAIRELLDAGRLDASDDEVHSMLAGAYLGKSAWTRVLESSATALRLNFSNAQAHLWRAEALRQMAAVEKQPASRLPLYTEARDHYREFLNQTNFSSSWASWLGFHFIGHGIGSRSHADRQPSYVSLRIAGFLGLCITEQRVGLLRRAREYCQRALKLNENAPITHFVLGNINRDLYNQEPSCDTLLAARRHYGTMIRLNGDLQEARNARNYLEQIGGVLAQLRCRDA
jgi:tetratricopeptide (TPR) repeat protein